jgi:hypothetical protein
MQGFTYDADGKNSRGSGRSRRAAAAAAAAATTAAGGGAGEGRRGAFNGEDAAASANAVQRLPIFIAAMTIVAAGSGGCKSARGCGLTPQTSVGTTTGCCRYSDANIEGWMAFILAHPCSLWRGSSAAPRADTPLLLRGSLWAASGANRASIKLSPRQSISYALCSSGAAQRSVAVDARTPDKSTRGAAAGRGGLCEPACTQRCGHPCWLAIHASSPSKLSVSLACAPSEPR